MSSQHAFDPLAAAYDDTFTNTIIGSRLRARVRERLALHFNPEDHVLELGCGTGADALWLAGRGIRVLATDASAHMLAAARARVADVPLARVERLDLRAITSSHVPVFSDEETFDGAFSNFGALNCLGTWKPLASWLAARVKPGGIIGLGIMSPLCVWEPLWHGLHLDFNTATRRWRKTTFQPDETTAPIAIHYPTIQRLTRDFAPDFRMVHVQPLGLFLPPSDVFPVIEKRPRLLKALTYLEQRFTKYRHLALFADHYWIEFEHITTIGNRS